MAFVKVCVVFATVLFASAVLSAHVEHRSADQVLDNEVSNGLGDVPLEAENQIEEGRGKKKETVALSMLLGSGMFTTLITVGLIAVKFLAFKSVLVGTISLILAAIDALSRIFNPQRNAQGYGAAGAWDAWKRNGAAVEKSFLVPQKPIVAPPSLSH